VLLSEHPVHAPSWANKPTIAVCVEARVRQLRRAGCKEVFREMASRSKTAAPAYAVRSQDQL
jgi:hypothetical protein